MRTTFRSEVVIRTLFVAGALLAPAAGGAQQERREGAAEARPQTARAGRVHVVRPGETLWSLSQHYLGDGHRWEEIVALNRDVVTSARTLEAGTTLTIPGERASTLPTKVANGVAALPAEGAGDDFFAPYAGPTVFFSEPRASSRRAGVGTNASVEWRTDRSPVSASAAPAPSTTSALTATPARDAPSGDALSRELLGAPWITDVEDVANAGMVTDRLEAMAIATIDGGRELHLYDRVAVRMPLGLRLDAGSELLAVVPGGLVRGGVLMIPAGVVRLTSVDSSNVAGDARVIAKYGRMEEGVLLVPFPEPSGAEASASVTDLTVVRPGGMGEPRIADGTVLSVLDGALLPTLQHVVLVDVGERLGARSGDRVTFYRDGASRAAGGESEVIARGTVLRVSARGASVLIVQQSQPALREGTPLRIALASRSHRVER